MQSLIITAFFTNFGKPQLNLIPLINIRNSSTGAIVIPNGIMYEIGDGQYGYEFSSSIPNSSYTVVCDGGVTLADSERYTYSSFEIPPIELSASFN